MRLGLGYQAMTEILDAINSNRATSATAFKNQFFRALNLITHISGDLMPVPAQRTRYELEQIPNATALVDAFPVRCRGNGKAWNPKYGTKVQKFQLVTDLRGTPLSVLPFRECRTHDSVLYNETLALVRETLKMAPWEMLIGDKAYIGKPLTITPTKFGSKKELTVGEAKFNKLLQLVRSPVERANSRLHSWRVIERSPFRYDVTVLAVRACVFLESLVELPRTRWITERTHIPAVLTVKEAIAKTQFIVKDWPAQRLRGLNSTHRAKSALPFKEARMETKKGKFLEESPENETSSSSADDDTTDDSDGSSSYESGGEPPLKKGRK